MFYSIRHITQFTYSNAVSESFTEVRMQPRSEALQRCLSFELGTTPRSRVSAYRDRMGNVIHHFDVPGQHNRLRITAESRVECLAPPALPESLTVQAWEELDACAADGELWDYLMPSTFAKSGEALSR